MDLLLCANTPKPRAPQAQLQSRADALNARFRHRSATAVLEAVLHEGLAGRVAMVSSFGAESAVLLHMIAVIDRKTQVLFIDTQMLFAETLVYQQELAERFRLENLTILRASDQHLRQTDPEGQLHCSDPDACCALRKTQPLQTALAGFDSWITGRKRFQGTTRAALEMFEPEPAGNRLKINPLAHWSAQDITTYMEENRLPRHPLVARGYRSIGCMPCTRPTGAGEDPRAGRWPGQAKQECGIHIGPRGVVRVPGDARG